MHTFESPTPEYLALEALQIEVAKHTRGEVPKENVYNVLQKVRGDITDSMADIVALDKKTADEYLSGAMAVRYQQRLADIQGELLAASSRLSQMANAGSLNIVPNVQSSTLTARITGYKGSLISEKNANQYLRDIRLYITALNSLSTGFDKQFFIEASKTEQLLGTVKERIESFDSPLGKFVVVNKDGNMTVDFTEKKWTPVQGFYKSGWTISKMMDYQLNFSNRVMDLSKVIFKMSQAMNRFICIAPEARTWSLFIVYAERLAEALLRISSTLVAEYKDLWSVFIGSVSDIPAQTVLV